MAELVALSVTKFHTVLTIQDRYNADGNLVDWWTAEDLKQFSALTGALAAQYSALEPLPGTL
jgi:predicted metalloendopeptidase